MGCTLGAAGGCSVVVGDKRVNSTENQGEMGRLVVACVLYKYSTVYPDSHHRRRRCCRCCRC